MLLVIFISLRNKEEICKSLAVTGTKDGEGNCEKQPYETSR